jgi:AhpD family alkylhydroperoxidase
MADYFERDDRKYVRDYKEHSADLLASYAAFSGAVFAEEGREIPKKYRELMALAVSVSKQCPYCIESHSTAAVAAGANEAELAEAAWVASAIGAGAAYTHGRLAFKLSGIHDHPAE